MKSTICLVFAMTFCKVFCLAQTTSSTGYGSSNQVNSSYSISLAQPVSAFTLSSEIKVPMTITNITNGDIFWSAVVGTDKDTWSRGFHFLLMKDGKEVETTFFHRKITGRQRHGDPDEVDRGDTVLLPKPPGIIFVLTIDLKRLYQITEPGKYTLQVTRMAEDNMTITRSNIVTLEIVAGGPPIGSTSFDR